jgi:hypothetical protein
MAFTAFLRHIGAPADRYLRSRKMPVFCDDPDMFIPLVRAWAFFDIAAQHEEAMLGWLVGAHIGDHNLNHGLLRKLETAPTLYQALQRLVQMANSEASHVQVGIQERKAEIFIYTCYSSMREADGYKHSQAYQLGLFLDLIRHFLGRDWIPDKIGIEHTIAPTIAQEYFPGSRFLTQQPMGYISVPRACLHRPVHRPAPDPGVAGERTLFRRLAARNLTYGALIDQVRFEEAKKLLQAPGALIEDVAISVGFIDQSNFTRMFRRIGGQCPKEFRKEALG